MRLSDSLHTGDCYDNDNTAISSFITQDTYFHDSRENYKVNALGFLENLKKHPLVLQV